MSKLLKINNAHSKELTKSSQLQDRLSHLCSSGTPYQDLQVLGTPYLIGIVIREFNKVSPGLYSVGLSRVGRRLSFATTDATDPITSPTALVRHS
jgi:hypothetical protein